jgi:hypothetical protein
MEELFVQREVFGMRSCQVKEQSLLKGCKQELKWE